jgi:hypothetical protein
MTQPAKPKANLRANQKPNRLKARLENAIANGLIPPYCENCGAIETPSWRRAWTREVDGNEELAEAMIVAPQMLFWEAVERNDKGEVLKFKILKKSVEFDDDSWSQMLLCNPCGLWLHKMKNMRPQNKWSKSGGKQGSKQSKKRPSRARGNGPLNPCPASRTRSKAGPKNAASASAETVAASSPAPTDMSSVHPEGETPQMDDDNDHDYEDEAGATPDDRSRDVTEELPNHEDQHPSTITPGRRWSKLDAREALMRAAKSSPVRRAARTDSAVGSVTPKSVRRSLFQDAQNDGPLKDLDASMVNSCSPRRSPRISSAKGDKPTEKENIAPTPHDDIDDLFESPSIGFDSASPTPRRRNPRINAIEKRTVLGNSPSLKKRKDLQAITPARLSAERLQRIQGLQDRSPRPQKSPAKETQPKAVPDDLSTSIASIDGMILDIFDENDRANFDLESATFAGENWADWLPADYVSPAETPADSRPAEDLLSVLFSDANDKDFNPDLLPFNFNDVVVPDSGFFSSDALPEASKIQSSEDVEAMSPV